MIANQGPDIKNQGYQTGAGSFTIRDNKPGSGHLQTGKLNRGSIFKIRDTKLVIPISYTKLGSDLQSGIPNRGPIVYNQGYQTGVRLFTVRNTKLGSYCLQSGIPNRGAITYKQ